LALGQDVACVYCGFGSLDGGDLRRRVVLCEEIGFRRIVLGIFGFGGFIEEFEVVGLD
tara:strand:- start:455 stop:628 length:174 start_codon:yes stop_codon:yes gene_type:complete